MLECRKVRKSEGRFEVGSLGRGGISEAASLGEQKWRLSAGVLGETALPRCSITACAGLRRAPAEGWWEGSVPMIPHLFSCLIP
jgi:hypothetical protein